MPCLAFLGFIYLAKVGNFGCSSLSRHIAHGPKELVGPSQVPGHQQQKKEGRGIQGVKCMAGRTGITRSTRS